MNHNRYLRLKIFLLIATLGFKFTTYSQLTISGRVTDNKGKLIEYATIVVKQDSTLISSTLTDSMGNYIIHNLNKGNYDVIYSFINSKTVIALNIYKDTSVNVQLSSTNNQLRNVIVTAKKPLFERKADRFVFNASRSSFAGGSSLWEMFKSTPLIITSEQNHSITIAGKQNISLYVNEVKSNLSGEALYNYLQSVNASNVEKIELITMPSSEYDAGGGAAIINIITKKNTTNGTKGSISLTDEQAFYNIQRLYSYLLYRKSNFGLQINAWANNTHQRDTEYDSIIFNYNGTSLKNINNQVMMHSPKRFYGGSISADYRINSKQLLNIMFDGSANWQKRQYTTNSSYSTTSNQPDSTINTYSNRTIQGHDYNININYRYTIDSLGKYLTIDAGYFDYLDQNNIRNSSYKNTATEIDNFISILPQKIYSYSLRSSLFYPINTKLNITLGLKYSSIHSNSDISFSIWNGSIYTKDNIRSNQFIYNEDISAAYTSINYTWNNKWDTKLGFRTEHTNINGREIITTQTVNNKYTNIFPTLFISYTANKDHQFSYSITRRIQRPQFWELNPGRTYTTPSIYTEGNPFLQPAKIFKQELSYTLKDKYVFLINHTYLDNHFSQFAVTIPGSEEIKYQRFNYGYAQTLNFATNINNSFLKKSIESNLTLTAGFIEYKGQIPSQLINNQSFYGNINFSNEFYISKKYKWQGAAYIDYNFPQANGIYFQKANYLLQINLKKTFNNGLSFTFIAVDVFKTNIGKYSFSNNASSNWYQFYNDTRKVMLIIKYAFGNTKVKKIQQIENTSNDDIKGRSQKKD